MKESEKDLLASEVAELRTTFDIALSDKRKYPVQEFRAFVKSARRYIQMTEKDELIHKSVARAVNGLREYLQVERKRIPGDILFEADRLECQLFSGYVVTKPGNSTSQYLCWSQNRASPKQQCAPNRHFQ
jgi:hypothetical protein